jgi:hypothetical protein
MEAIGITLSVFPIFSLCLEYFQYFKTAQSLSFDCQILFLKLDFEHERFVIWGEKHGIREDTNSFESNSLHNNKSLLVRDALILIEALFKNSTVLYDKYGVKKLDQNNHEEAEAKTKFISTAALKRFRNRYTTQNSLNNGTDHIASRPDLAARTRWAVFDKSKFEVLVKDIRELVTSLYEILPVPNKERDRMVLEDMRSLLPDTDRLKQVELASEGLYAAWSEAASLMVLASETGSIATESLSNEVPIHRFVRKQ